MLCPYAIIELNKKKKNAMPARVGFVYSGETVGGGIGRSFDVGGPL